MKDLINLLKNWKSGGGLFSSLVLVIFLEMNILFPEAIRHILLPIALLGAIIGCVLFSYTPENRRIRVGLWLLVPSAIVYVILLYFLSSSYWWQFYVMYVSVFIGNLGLFTIIGDRLQKMVGRPPDGDGAAA